MPLSQGAGSRPKAIQRPSGDQSGWPWNPFGVSTRRWRPSASMTAMTARVDSVVFVGDLATVRRGLGPYSLAARIAARGRDGIVDQVVRANALARELAALVEREPSLELAAAPETSIVAFRARPPGCPPDRLEAINRALPEAVQSRGRAFVTGTVYEERETVRACILHPGTTKTDLATLVAEVVAAAAALAAARS
jgi:glutamate/tyrosine decarboxylase-like PLP-dependent enzyme